MNDSQTMKNVKNIVESSGEIVLIHLPLKSEIFAGHHLSQAGNLSKSLESIFQRKIHYLGGSIQEAELPEKMDLAPHDEHPNFDGIFLYARKVSEHIVDSGFIRDVHR